MQQSMGLQKVRHNWSTELKDTYSSWAPRPKAYSNSHPSCRWCHPTISTSVILFSSCFQSFLASGSFPMSHFFASGGQCIGAWQDWRQEEEGLTEDEMIGWHHRLDGHEFEEALGVGDRQGTLACCSPWGLKKLDMTEWLNSSELKP